MRHTLWRCARSAGIAAQSVCLALALGQAVSTAAAAANPASASDAPFPSPRTDEARLLFLGDVMLGRYVGAAITAHGADAPFDRARTWLSAADVTVANLEGPLVPPGALAVPPPSPGLLNLTGSTASAGALARAGFDVLSVANNHSLDAGEPGLRHTRRALTGVGIAPVGLRAGGADGVGVDGAVGQMPVIEDVRGIRIAFLAYTLVLNPTTPPSRAAAAIAYIDPAVPADIARAASEVKRARSGSAAAVDADADADANADLVAVVLHWGIEYAARPSAGQQRIARALAAAGADLVVGAHPHVVQGVEALGVVGALDVEPLRHAPLSGAPPQPATARPTIVAYSLGNALFDQGGDAATRRGAALEVGVDSGGVRWARLIPLAIESRPNGYAMRPLDDPEGQYTARRATRPSSGQPASP
ncbi:MAG: CapA family protein [Ardenticatenales bacterium]|nr:CapA family protein [Ardenticatenales bacterium]